MSKILDTKTNEKKTYAIGIDLGTTYTCVGVYREGNVEIIPTDLGSRTMPSYVSFGSERLIGEAAKNECCANPQNTVFDAKRLIGRLFSDKVIQHDMLHWPFEVVSGDKKEPLIQVEYQGEKKKYSAEEISSMILSRAKQMAETYLGTPITDAVITVPAYFNDSQRQATKHAGQIAGLNVLRIVPEPTAAAIAYGLDKIQNKNTSRILVFDLGGGTFDVSLLELNGGIFSVLATSGDTHLGGEDFDNKLVEFCIADIYKKFNFDISKNITACRRLRNACETAKRYLSTQNSAAISVDSLFTDSKQKLQNYSTTITRSKFENLCQEYFDKCLAPVETVLKDAKIKKSKSKEVQVINKEDKDLIDHVVLVGGSSRIPCIQQMLIKYFGRENILCKTINPDEAVAFGAAVQAFSSQGNEDEKTKQMILVDATPLSLGVEVSGGRMCVLIPRGTSLPTDEITRTFSTQADNQPSVLVQVYEGEREFVKDNHFLGKFELKGIPPMPRGSPKIVLSLRVDNDNILNASACEHSTGNKKALPIDVNKGRLSEDQIAQAIAQAEKFKNEDILIRKRVESKNDLENQLYSLQNVIKKFEFEDKDSKDLDIKVKDTIQWMESSTDAKLEDYLNKFAELEKISRPIILKHSLKKENMKETNTEIKGSVNVDTKK